MFIAAALNASTAPLAGQRSSVFGAVPHFFDFSYFSLVSPALWTPNMNFRYRQTQGTQFVVTARSSKVKQKSMAAVLFSRAACGVSYPHSGTRSDELSAARTYTFSAFRHLKNMREPCAAPQHKCQTTHKFTCCAPVIKHVHQLMCYHTASDVSLANNMQAHESTS
jgi:hypothetical protein